MTYFALLAALLAVPPTNPALTVGDAIRLAWARHPGLASESFAQEAAEFDSSTARHSLMPSLEVSARATVTNEPLGAFGLKLDEGRLVARDFDPAQLNHPSAIGGLGLGVVVTQPLYSGGRLTAERRAAVASAEAGHENYRALRQEVAAEVVRAYVGTQIGTLGVTFAEASLESARSMEKFVRSRVVQHLLLESEALRASSFRAQRESELSAVQQSRESIRSVLELLIGEPLNGANLSSAIGNLEAISETTQETPKVRAASFRAAAAKATAEAARGALLPEIFAQLGAQTLRSSFNQGAVWESAMIGARWKLSLGQIDASNAAEARSNAAKSASAWQAQQLSQELGEARRGLDASQVRIKSSREAIEALELAKSMTVARHREGLIPLSEVLDAEIGLSAAHTQLLRAQLEARLARASMALYTGQPVEGITQ